MWNPSPVAPATPRIDPRLALLRAWISLGTLALLLTPPSQWHSHSIGWLPYWCVVAPALSLAWLRRGHLASTLAAILLRRLDPRAAAPRRPAFR